MICQQIELPKNYNRPSCPICGKTTTEHLVDFMSLPDFQLKLFREFIEDGLVRFQGEKGYIIPSQTIIFICLECMGEGEDCSWIFRDKK